MKTQNIEAKFSALENKLNLEIKTDVLQNRFVSQIQKILESKNKNNKWLANKMQVSESFLSQLFNLNKRFNLEQLTIIQEVLGVQFKIEAVKPESLTSDFKSDNTPADDNEYSATKIIFRVNSNESKAS